MAECKFLQGEHNGRSKLTKEQVRRIIAQRGKVPLRKLAERYHVCLATISKVQRGKRWGHLQPTQ